MIIKRKIRNGRVKINNIWYYPNDHYMLYDGRLDGYQFYFELDGRYDSCISMYCPVEEDHDKFSFGFWSPFLNWYKA